MSRALVLLLLVSAGCAGSTSVAGRAPAELSEYAPLAVGSTWTYDMAYPGQTGEMTVKLTGEQDGYIVDDKNGAFRLTGDGLRDRQRFLVRYPLVVGTQWKTVVGPSAVEHTQITSVGQPCAAVAGQFDDCLVVHSWIRQSEQMTLHIEWTWAKGVGLVKLETEADLAGKGRVPQVRQSLRRYTLVGEPPRGAASAPAPAAVPAEDGAPATWTKE
jgi:hypothetical protein